MAISKKVRASAAALAGLSFVTTADAEVNRGMDAQLCYKESAGLLRCGFIDERPGLEHLDVYRANAHVISAGSSTGAWICVLYWDAPGGVCDTTVVVSGTGTKTITVDGSNISLWRDVAYQWDFAHFSISGASGTAVRGIWFGEQP